MTTRADFLKWLAAPARRITLVEVGVLDAGVETTKYLASKGFGSESTDTPASTPYDPCLIGGATFSANLSFDGQINIGIGDLVIDNPAGERDAWLDGMVWANRPQRIFMGDASWARADFFQIFEGVTGNPGLIGTGDPRSLSLTHLDKLQRLNNPISETVLGGTSNNKDRLIPSCFGECFNVTPLLSDPVALDEKVHDAAIEDIYEARSNAGVPETITKTIASGKFTLAASPGNTNITATVQGDKPGGVWNTTISTIVQRIVTGYGPAATRFSAAPNVDLDSTQLAAFNVAHPQAVGLYCAARVNVMEACQQLAWSVGASVTCTALGLLRLVQLALPAAGAAVAIGAADIEYHSLHIKERPPVKAAVKLGYAKNWTPQESLAAGLADASVPLFRDEWLTVSSSSAGAATDYKLPTQAEMEETLLLVEADAQAEADRRRDLWSTDRRVYSMVGFAHLMLTELGDAVTLTNTRFGLAAGKSGIVVGIARDWLKGRITIEVLV